MKDSKFIELLNLYVDHQITPADAALLEGEVRSNPERYRVYREYCMMQKACAELAEAFRGEASATPSKVVEFPSPRRSSGALPYVAAVAGVAACAAFVFAVRWNSHEMVVTAAGNAAPVVAVAKVPVAPLRAERPALQPVFGPRLLASTTEPAADQAALGDWMNSIQLSSLPGTSDDDLRFDAQATLQPVNRPGRNGRPFQGKVEWTAFTFQK